MEAVSEAMRMCVIEPRTESRKSTGNDRIVFSEYGSQMRELGILTVSIEVQQKGKLGGHRASVDTGKPKTDGSSECSQHSAQLFAVIENEKFPNEVVAPFERLNGAVLGPKNSPVKRHWAAKFGSQSPKPNEVNFCRIIVRLLETQQQRSA